MELSFTLIIIIVTVLVSIWGFSSPKVINDLIFYPPAVSRQNQVYRFFTCGFIHADYSHLIFNMITLYFFGPYVERGFEELFGEIEDEYDTEEFVEKQLSDNEYIFSGRVELDFLEEKYGFDFGEEETETLSGYIINYHETIPRQKERIIIDDYEFDILSVSDTRIEMVKMKKLK